jgi:hypothetical protein
MIGFRILRVWNLRIESVVIELNFFGAILNIGLTNKYPHVLPNRSNESIKDASFNIVFIRLFHCMFQLFL